jgi:hypothetical protein
MKEWEQINLMLHSGVALWGGNPVDTVARADYFDSLYHSSAVVGLNTSAFIEGAIAGRQVFTILLPEYRENQEGTIHFHYLLDVAGGLLHSSRSIEAHAAQLEVMLTTPEHVIDRSRAFVEAFVRPQGLERASTPRFIEAMVELVTLRRASRYLYVSRWARAGAVLFAWMFSGFGRRLMMSQRERLEAERIQSAAERKGAARDVAIARKEIQRNEKVRRRTNRYQEKRRLVRQWRRERFIALVRERIGWQ